jgi:hypothetical protein
MVEVMVDVWRVSNQQNTFDEEFDGVGKLLSWDVQYPKFGVSSFKENTTTYYADASQDIAKYENPLD